MARSGAPQRNPNEVVTTGDAARYLGVHRNTVLYWVRNGIIPHERVYGRYTFRIGDLDRFRDDPPPSRRNHPPPLPVLGAEVALVILLLLGVGCDAGGAGCGCHAHVGRCHTTLPEAL